MYGDEHVSFTCSKIGSLVDVNNCKDADGLRCFYYLVQVLNNIICNCSHSKKHMEYRLFFFWASWKALPKFILQLINVVRIMCCFQKLNVLFNFRLCINTHIKLYLHFLYADNKFTNLINRISSAWCFHWSTSTSKSSQSKKF